MQRPSFILDKIENRLVFHGGACLQAMINGDATALVACFGDEGVAARNNRLQTGSSSCIHKKRLVRHDWLAQFPNSQQY